MILKEVVSALSGVCSTISLLNEKDEVFFVEEEPQRSAFALCVSKAL